MKKGLKLFFMISVLLLVFLFTSCDGGGSGTPDGLTGTWVITTSSSGTNIGTLTTTLTYFSELFGIDLWIGTGTISGSASINGTYSAGGSEISDIYGFSVTHATLDSDSDGFEDQIDYTVITNNGSTMSGSYSGESGAANSTSPFYNVSGTFIATKQ